jgi:hypothetical protein
MPDEQVQDFTFYGDLLGIASAYRLSPKVAHDKLDKFYNVIFNTFGDICHQSHGHFHVAVVQRFWVMWGRPAALILRPLQEAYLQLVTQNLLLRGALVDGQLKKEPRLEVKHFRKFLPTNDTLARAVGLEKTVKGARLLIESRLAQKLLRGYEEWLTLEGYIAQQYPDVPIESPLRRICPSPSGTCYELLYFWKPPSTTQISSENGSIADRIKEIAKFQDAEIAQHFRETLRVLKRSEIRSHTALI